MMKLVCRTAPLSGTVSQMRCKGTDFFIPAARKREKILLPSPWETAWGSPLGGPGAPRKRAGLEGVAACFPVSAFGGPPHKRGSQRERACALHPERTAPATAGERRERGRGVPVSRGVTWAAGRSPARPSWRPRSCRRAQNPCCGRTCKCVPTCRARLSGQKRP